VPEVWDTAAIVDEGLQERGVRVRPVGSAAKRDGILRENTQQPGLGGERYRCGWPRLPFLLTGRGLAPIGN